MEPALAVWSSFIDGTVDDRGSIHWLDAGCSAAGRSFLSVVSLPLRCPAGFPVRPHRTISLGRIFDHLGLFRADASPMDCGNPLRLRLSRTGLPEETPRRRHDRPRHHELVARPLGDLGERLEILVKTRPVLSDHHYENIWAAQ